MSVDMTMDGGVMVGYIFTVREHFMHGTPSPFMYDGFGGC